MSILCGSIFINICLKKENGPSNIWGSNSTIDDSPTKILGEVDVGCGNSTCATYFLPLDRMKDIGIILPTECSGNMDYILICKHKAELVCQETTTVASVRSTQAIATTQTIAGIVGDQVLFTHLSLIISSSAMLLALSGILIACVACCCMGMKMKKKTNSEQKGSCKVTYHRGRDESFNDYQEHSPYEHSHI